MKGFLASAAVLALSSLASVRAQSQTTNAVQNSYSPQQPTASPATGVTVRTPSALGCFSNPGDMWDMGPFTFQTDGWCQPLCVRQAAIYFALVNGTNCFCGNSVPSSSLKVNGDECNTSCNGDNAFMCGGTNRWAIFADNYRSGDETGSIQITTLPQTWFGHSTTSSSTLATSVSSKQQSIVVVTTAAAQTSAASGSSTSSSSGGSNKAAIAAGVVVGVIVLAAVIGGSIFYVRQRKKRELEEERHKHESMMRIVNRAEKPPSFGSDQRLEPSVMFQHRQSDASIMDNQDYSRRILKVTNPDAR